MAQNTISNVGSRQPSQEGIVDRMLRGYGDGLLTGGVIMILIWVAAAIRWAISKRGFRSGHMDRAAR